MRISIKVKGQLISLNNNKNLNVLIALFDSESKKYVPIIQQIFFFSDEVFKIYVLSVKTAFDEKFFPY